MQDNKGKRIAVDDKYNRTDILTILHFHSNAGQNLGLKQLHVKSIYLLTYSMEQSPSWEAKQ